MNNAYKHPEKIKEMFNLVSKDYDKLNNLMTFGIHKRIKRNLIKNIPSPVKILDLCTGTGDLAGFLKKEYPQSEVIGVDFSEKMLEIARKKNPKINFIETDCTNLPFEDESFDLCVISFGLRNIENMQKALEEIYRILKPDGIFINLDLGKPNKFFNIFLKPYMYLWVSILGKIFHGDDTPYQYLAVSNEEFPSSKKLAETFEKIGFQKINTKNYLFGQVASQTMKKP